MENSQILDVDVSKELESKNNAIYKNKVNIDIDNSIINTKSTIINLLNLFKIDVINKIIEIEGSLSNKNTIIVEVNNAFNKINEIVNTILERKKFKLIEISDLGNIGTSLESINLMSNDFIDNLKLSIQAIVDELSSKLNTRYNEFQKKRLKVYLNSILFSNIISKIKECFKDRDIILENNFKENEIKMAALSQVALNSK